MIVEAHHMRNRVQVLVQSPADILIAHSHIDGTGTWVCLSKGLHRLMKHDCLTALVYEFCRLLGIFKPWYNSNRKLSRELKERFELMCVMTAVIQDYVNTLFRFFRHRSRLWD